MVGTLVVSLPSAHTGGEMVVEHGGESVTYRTSKEHLSFVAFYADCRHQVKPVKSGHRVTLTLNLLADSETGAQGAGPVADPAHCLTEHFTTPATRRCGRTEPGPPNRLVYLLDHEYTQRGLNWNRLKGVDAERAALLRAAADRAWCQAVLALAEVKETWDARPSDSDPWDDYDYYDDGDEDEEEEDSDYDAPRDRASDHDNYQLNELIDDEITLGWWTGPDGTGGEPISLYVPDSEVCATTPSANLTPYQSEYEGYMGNYGNTLDRWYRRAAVVVWARDRAFAARAEAGSQEALSELHARLEAGDLDGHVPLRNRSRRSGKQSDHGRDCWVRRCMWRQAWARPGRRRCCWSRSGGDGRAGARRRACGSSRAVRRGVDARGHRRMVQVGALLRNGQVPAGREAAGAMKNSSPDSAAKPAAGSASSARSSWRARPFSISACRRFRGGGGCAGRGRTRARSSGVGNLGGCCGMLRR